MAHYTINYFGGHTVSHTDEFDGDGPMAYIGNLCLAHGGVLHFQRLEFTNSKNQPIELVVLMTGFLVKKSRKTRLIIYRQRPLSNNEVKGSWGPLACVEGAHFPPHDHCQVHYEMNCTHLRNTKVVGTMNAKTAKADCSKEWSALKAAPSSICTRQTQYLSFPSTKTYVVESEPIAITDSDEYVGKHERR